MNGIDWIIVGLVVLFALYGAVQGFVVGLLSLAGFAIGAFIGTRLGPLLLPEGSESPYAPMFGLLGAVLAGAILATGLEGVGQRLRGYIVTPGGRAVDGTLGALLTACVALLLAWVLGAIALQSPQARDLRRDLQRSVVLRELNDVLPPSGPILNALARIDPSPRVRGDLPKDLPAPREAIARDPQVRAAADGVVKVLGTACGLGLAGSGWIAAPELVVTNAHVVAGEEDTTVQLHGEGDRLPAQAVHFDSRNDVAVLRVPGLGGTPLPIADQPRESTQAAILGFPRNGPFDVRAGRLGATLTALSEDAYGRGPIRRRLTALRGLVRPGNSGGPMVDGRGRVVTTIFAATTSGPRGGYGVPNDVVADALRDVDSVVGTGPCAG